MLENLTKEALEEISSTLDTLETLAGQSSRQNRHIDREMGSVVAPLLIAEGYKIEYVDGKVDRGVDVIAKRNDEDTLVIENKFYSTGQPVGKNVIEKLIAAASRENAQSAIVVSNTGFFRSAEDLARQEEPIKL